MSDSKITISDCNTPEVSAEEACFCVCVMMLGGKCQERSSFPINCLVTLYLTCHLSLAVCAELSQISSSYAHYCVLFTVCACVCVILFLLCISATVSPLSFHFILSFMYDR